MEKPPHYDFRDVLWAPAKALSAKRILVMTIFLCLALTVYDLFLYLALAIEGEKISFVWSAYDIFPFIPFHFSHTVAASVYALGLLLTLHGVMLGMFAVSAIDIEQIRGNRFFSFWGAMKFAFQRFRQILLSELSIVLFVGFIILLFMAFGLVARIPWIGEWLYSVLFVFPTFIISIITIFIVLVLIVSCLLMPTVASAERKGETFSAILETFSTIIRQPWRWLGFTVFSLAAAKVCGFVYAYFCFRATQFLAFTSGLSGGGKIEQLIRSGLKHLPADSDLVRETINIFPGISWSFSIDPWLRGGTDEPVSYVMSFMLFLIFASVFGYMFSVIATAQARGFMVIRFVKDGYRLADESPLFFTDEPVNPPIDEGEV
ncbi:MAG TPA: hypothetical protein PLF13_09885 [candidate division Zixibacteria bacterium]|nr:hypothetical protein [candidate division Zixibacteria bacterium]